MIRKLRRSSSRTGRPAPPPSSAPDETETAPHGLRLALLGLALFVLLALISAGVERYVIG